MLGAAAVLRVRRRAGQAARPSSTTCWSAPPTTRTGRVSLPRSPGAGSYAGQAARATQFADEAVDRRAARRTCPELLADCLDAALAAHWGPGRARQARVELAGRLDEVAAHVLDPDARLQAHLWGLQVACEALDVQAMHRQMRALELLGEESPRALFFAASRRLMLDLLRGRTDTAARLIEHGRGGRRTAVLADAWMVLKAMDGYSAAQSGDTATCAAGAAECEAFALAEGVTAVCAEAAFLWVCAGQPDRARALVRTFHGRVLDDLPRDVNWLLTLQCVLEAALAVGDREVVEKAARLLTPYAGGRCSTPGAVMFHGVTDDTLSRAAALLGDPEGRRPTARQGPCHLRTHRRPAGGATGSGHGTRRRSARAPGGRARCTCIPAADGLWLVGPADGSRAGSRAARLRLPARAAAPARSVRVGARSGHRRQRHRDATRARRRARRPGARGLPATAERHRARSHRGRGMVRRRPARTRCTPNATRSSASWPPQPVSADGHGRPAPATNAQGSPPPRRSPPRSIASPPSMRRSAGTCAPRIRTGLQCSYQPDPDDERDWILDQRPQPPK